jgi:hypothetical protein
MKQTAVEWLKQKTSDMTIHKTHLNDTISEWQDGYNVALEDVIKLLNQALEMEKQQIEKMYSEEEVLELLRKSHFVEQNIDEWFEPFKKK